MHGFGPVDREENEPVFHAAWEAAVLAIERAGGARGFFNIDEFRHGIERMAPAHYLRATYYEKWLHAVTPLLLEKAVAGAERLASRVPYFDRRPAPPPPHPFIAPPPPPP